MSEAVEQGLAGQAAPRESGSRWLGLFLLPVPVGLAVWRVGALGYGPTDFVPHFLLDLLVSSYLVILLSGPLRGRPPLPAVSGVILLSLALYMGWLYLAAGIDTAALIVVVTLGAGFGLRWLGEHVTLVTFVRSYWVDRLDLGGGSVPADALYVAGGLIGGPARTWRRYVAVPIIAGLLLAFVAVRVARPLDKRAEARAVLEDGSSFQIGREFLKAVTNGNAALFTRERALWFVAPAARGVVMSQTEELFVGVKRALEDLDLQWVDLGSLHAVAQPDSRPPAAKAYRVQTYAGTVVAYLEDPESPPQGLAWIDPGHPGRGFLAWISPLEVSLAETSEGTLVVGLSGTVEIRLRRP